MIGHVCASQFLWMAILCSSLAHSYWIGSYHHITSILLQVCSSVFMLIFHVHIPFSTWRSITKTLDSRYNCMWCALILLGQMLFQWHVLCWFFEWSCHCSCLWFAWRSVGCCSDPSAEQKVCLSLPYPFLQTFCLWCIVDNMFLLPPLYTVAGCLSRSDDCFSKFFFMLHISCLHATTPCPGCELTPKLWQQLKYQKPLIKCQYMFNTFNRLESLSLSSLTELASLHGIWSDFFVKDVSSFLLLITISDLTHLFQTF